MCNEAARRIALGQLREDWSDLRIPLSFPEGLPNLAAEESIRITDPALILRAAEEGDGAEAVVRRWSWPGPGGRPVYNYRSEGRSIANGPGSGRCLMVVDSFFEFTDPAPDAPRRTRKDKWRFSDAGHPWFCIAGIWRTEPALGEGRQAQAFAMLTCEPGPDIAPYHARQVVVPPRALWRGWLDGSLPSADVCRPSPGGTFRVERA